MRLRVGLIGLGGVGRLHLDAYAAAEHVTVVAAADLDPAIRKLHEGTGIALYADAGAMLAAETLDLVCVLTPPASHAALVGLCADAGVHILCEKPLAPSVAEAEAMVARCRSAGIRLFYGASYRFLPALKRARDLIAAGAIGDVLILREQEVGGAGPEARVILPADHYPPGGPGGSPMGLADHGVHLIDAFAWLTGGHVVSAYGRGNVSGETPAPEYMVMTMAGGAVGMLLYDEGTYPTELPAEGVFSWGSFWDATGFHPSGAWAAHPGVIHIHGTRGSLRILHYANALFLRDAEGMRQIALEGAPAPFHFATQIDAFAAEILTDAAPATPAEAGVAALRVLEAGYASAREGRVIAV